MASNQPPANGPGEISQFVLSEQESGNCPAQKSSSNPLSANRRQFLKQVSALGIGAVATPAFLQSHDAQAATQTAAPDIPLSSSKRPVLQPNENNWTHLLSVDFRNENDLDALNLRYGSGTAVKTGNLIFDAERGVCAGDDKSGVEIHLNRILDLTTRTNLAIQGQLTVEMETPAISDPWFLDQYYDRYALVRQAPNFFPNSTGNLPPDTQKNFLRLVSANGVAGPSLRGPMPESPSGLNTRANNLSIRMHDQSFQDMIIGIHSAMHHEFTSVTTSWWGRKNFMTFVDGVPIYLGGPSAVGPHGVEVQEYFYSMNDVQSDTGPRETIRLFFGKEDVFIRRMTLGAVRAWYPVHPLFEVWASFGDSFTHRGGFANSRFPRNDLWDANHIYNFTRRLALANYRAGHCWNNSLGGGCYVKTASKSLWNNGGELDLSSLMDINPSFVMMAASHNDAGYIAHGTTPGSDLYQKRLAEVKADVLEHIEVILTGTSPNWYQPARTSRAKIGIITTPISPRATGWDEPQAQAQFDLNRFILEEVKDWVINKLGSTYGTRIATYDAAALFGASGMVDYHPLFQSDGIGTHPNWWGGELLNSAWWRCALQLVG